VENGVENVIFLLFSIENSNLTEKKSLLQRGEKKGGYSFLTLNLFTAPKNNFGICPIIVI